MHPSCTHLMPYLPSWHSHATASHEPSFEKDIVSAPDLSPASWSVNVALRDQTTITTHLLEMDKVACKACGTCACLPDLHLRRRCVDCRAGAGSSLPSRIANFICSYVCSPTCGTDSAQSQNVASDVFVSRAMLLRKTRRGRTSCSSTCSGLRVTGVLLSGRGVALTRTRRVDG